MDTQSALETYGRISSEMYRLECISSLLGWDQQVYMPEGGAEDRALQEELIQTLHHRLATSDELWQSVDYLHERMDELTEEDTVNIRETRRNLERQRKLPEAFVAECARTFAEGYNVWVKARPANDFEAVKDVLSRIIELSRKEADIVGYVGHPYDALIDKFEPYGTIGFIKPLLSDLGNELSKLVGPISEKFGSVKPISGSFPKADQEKLIRKIVTDMGYSFETGRIDNTAHPFMTNIGRRDFRITTHYDETDYKKALYSSIHETGHALYELGFAYENAGKPMGMAVSMGIHESQSRLWENIVGRSHEFCSYLSELLKDSWGAPENLWEQVNQVKPGLIRIDADEVTYSLHVVIRMLLEEALMTGELSVDDLPSAWNDMYKKYLGVSSDTDKDGVMQDVHWYSGAIGYFPSYALGNLYNSAMYEKVSSENSDLSAQISRGEFGPLLNWLGENVHRHGMRYNARDLITHITGKDLSTGPFLKYVKAKFGV